MKKNAKLILFFLIIYNFSFANDNFIKSKLHVNEKIAESICCRRTGQNSSGEEVSVRACVPYSGDLVVDRGKACEKASKAVIKALESL